MSTREESYGKSVLRWQPSKDGGFSGVVIRDRKATKPIHDMDEHQLLTRLRNEAGRFHPDYVGFDAAITRFLHYFPRGLASATNERGYKETASHRLVETLSPEQAVTATDGDAARVANARIQTDMLSPFEAARLRDTLLGPTGGAFLRGAAVFADGNHKRGADAMASAVKPHGRISWPILTYLPFMWDVRRHMFLKPLVTCDFADRVGHGFAHIYSAEPNPETYLSLLDLVETTRVAIAALRPRDNIDIQSFIWVVGEYRRGDEHE